jgi:transcription elongation factor
VSRLDDLHIRLMVEGPAVSIYVRDHCIAAVGGTSGDNQGSTGMMTEQGLAYLVWRDGALYLAAKGGETPATPEQVETIRKFSQDLKNALNDALKTALST